MNCCWVVNESARRSSISLKVSASRCISSLVRGIPIFCFRFSAVIWCMVAIISSTGLRVFLARNAPTIPVRNTVKGNKMNKMACRRFKEALILVKGLPTCTRYAIRPFSNSGMVIVLSLKGLASGRAMSKVS